MILMFFTLVNSAKVSLQPQRTMHKLTQMDGLVLMQNRFLVFWGFFSSHETNINIGCGEAFLFLMKFPLFVYK